MSVVIWEMALVMLRRYIHGCAERWVVCCQAGRFVTKNEKMRQTCVTKRTSACKEALWLNMVQLGKQQQTMTPSTGCT